MKYQTYIEELQNLARPLEIHHIIWWLMKYENEFYKAIADYQQRQKINCYKNKI